MNESVKAKVRLFAVIPVVLFLAGCMVGPNFKPPQTAMPSAWEGVTKETAEQPTVVTPTPAELAEWWQEFSDPELTKLVEEAIAANLDMQFAEAQLRQARAQRGVVAGALWPAVNGSASYQRTHSAGTPPVGGLDQNLFQAGLDAVWELDIFGGIRRNVESADANIQAAQEGLRDVQVSLAAEVALNYVELRGFQQQIVIAEENLKAQRHTADITRQRFNAGFVGALDVANADAQVATTESQIPVLETSARQAIYALSVLLARPPADLVKELSETEVIPVTPPEVPIGLPSDLLRRRPDIRQAEAQIHSATAQIGVATADLFPKFSLTGSVNWQAAHFDQWFTDPSRSSSFGPSASWAIFQGGSIVSNIHVQEALRDQAFITYQKIVLTALQDVESALVAFSNEWEHRKDLNDAVVANRKAVTLAMQLYTEGQTDFLSVLDAERSLYASENALVQSTSTTATDLIALYKALGGGWAVNTSYSQVSDLPPNSK